MFQRNIIKILFGINLIGHSLNLFTICSSSFIGYRVPILSISTKTISSSLFLNGKKEIIVSPIVSGFSYSNLYVDSLTQALILTSIVIGLATISIFIALIININKEFNSTDILILKKLKG